MLHKLTENSSEFDCPLVDIEIYSNDDSVKAEDVMAGKYELDGVFISQHGGTFDWIENQPENIKTTALQHESEARPLSEYERDNGANELVSETANKLVEEQRDETKTRIYVVLKNRATRIFFDTNRNRDGYAQQSHYNHSITWPIFNKENEQDAELINHFAKLYDETVAIHMKYIKMLKRSGFVWDQHTMSPKNMLHYDNDTLPKPNPAAASDFMEAIRESLIKGSTRSINPFKISDRDFIDFVTQAYQEAELGKVEEDKPYAINKYDRVGKLSELYRLLVIDTPRDLISTDNYQNPTVKELENLDRIVNLNPEAIAKHAAANAKAILKLQSKFDAQKDGENAADKEPEPIATPPQPPHFPPATSLALEPNSDLPDQPEERKAG